MAGPPRKLGWEGFSAVWWHIVRRVVLGDAARDDQELTGLLAAVLAATPAAPASTLAGRCRNGCSPPTPPASPPPGLWPCWPPPRRGRPSRRELAADGHPAAARELPYLRACTLESVRLWPTTLAVLRDTTTETSWGAVPCPRDRPWSSSAPSSTATSGPCRTPTASSPRSGWTAAPKATGRSSPSAPAPGTCAGQDLVLFLVSTLLAAVLAGHGVRRLEPARLDPGRPLPRTLNHTTLRLAVSRSSAGLAT